MHRFRSLNRSTPGVILVLCSALTGCGSTPAEVSGVVRCNGQPLPMGSIVLLGADGVPRGGRIGPDGSFTVRAPAGPARVMVTAVPELRLDRPAGAPQFSQARAVPTRWSANAGLVPQRYSDPDASGLTAQVKRGKTSLDFDLTSP